MRLSDPKCVVEIQGPEPVEIPDPNLVTVEVSGPKYVVEIPDPELVVVGILDLVEVSDPNLVIRKEQDTLVVELLAEPSDPLKVLISNVPDPVEVPNYVEVPLPNLAAMELSV